MKQLDFRGLVDAAADIVAVFDRGHRHVYVNAALERAIGVPAKALLGKRNDDVMPPEEAAVWREALEDVLRSGRQRAIECTIATPAGPRRFASVITQVPGDLVCAVSRDVTEAKRAHEAASYLAKAGALLERFDPGTSLQAIVDLAVPVLADWCFIHIKTAGHPVLAAIANADPVKVAAVRARNAAAHPRSPDTAVARVLAGGPGEIVDVDAAVLAQAARDPAHLEVLRKQGYRSGVVAPLPGRDGVLGAVTFAMAESGRRYDAADLDMLAELARRTGIALDNARLFAAEQEARRHAEEARDRTRRLHVLAARLSSALTPPQVATIACEEVVAVLHAYSGAASVRDGDSVRILGIGGPCDEDSLARVAHVPLTTAIPIADAVRTSELVWCASEAELVARYSHLEGIWRKLGIRSWGAVPFRFEGGTVGSLALSFTTERELGPEDREFLAGVGQLTAQALERARLYEALRNGDEQLRVALTAARAATWQYDLVTGIATRDSAYSVLLGVRNERAVATDEAIHPDDRAAVRAEFDRTLRDRTPFEPEVRVRRDDGSYMWTRSHGRIMYDPAGKPRMLAGVIVDIDEAKQASLRADEERRLNETLQREHKEQLELAVERARLADRRKDEFLAMLGHELRNPLAPIATALELMELKDKHALHKEREVIRRQVDHLSRLIDDLLDVSRITRGKIQLDRQVLEIGAVLAKAIEIASPWLEKRMQELTIDVPREGLPVDADPTRLAQVFQNLLTNAAKYSEARSQIVLRARHHADRVVVELTDQGIGISVDLMPRLFELFVQGNRALDRSQGGLGIGLTIAKSLCELHGGTISAASAGLGRGSTFTVTLPRAVRADPPGPVRAGAHAAPIVTGRRVLVVDDNVDAAQTLHEFLTALGHEVVVAHDGVAALELAGSFKPDIAVLDIGLPVMDGYELARKLREQLGPAQLRLIAVTGYGQETDRARAREAGFDHHLVKPIALDALVPLLAPETRAGEILAPSSHPAARSRV